MKLFVDDIRTGPDDWITLRTITEAIRFLATQQVEEISLDHDIHFALGPDKKTFISAATWEDFSPVAWFIAGMPRKTCPQIVRIHTANPSGFQRLFDILQHSNVEQIFRDLSFRDEWTGSGPDDEQVCG